MISYSSQIKQQPSPSLSFSKPLQITGAAGNYPKIALTLSSSSPALQLQADFTQQLLHTAAHWGTWCLVKTTHLHHHLEARTITNEVALTLYEGP